MHIKKHTELGLTVSMILWPFSFVLRPWCCASLDKTTSNIQYSIIKMLLIVYHILQRAILHNEYSNERFPDNTAVRILK